jgi:hypothetical protein
MSFGRFVSSTFAFLSTVLLSACSLFGASQVGQARYKTLHQEGQYSLREYQPTVLAEVEIKAEDYRSAANQGFRILFRYITGNNQGQQKVPMTAPVVIQEKGRKIPMAAPVIAQQKGRKIPMAAPVIAQQKGQKIAMTSPVITQKKGQKIAMTSPVITQKKGQKIPMTAPVLATKQAAQVWQIAFVLPAGYKVSAAPTPLNSEVKIRALSLHLYAVYQFSGTLTATARQRAITKLQSWLQAQNYKAIDGFMFAQYNSPWTLPFARRNEVMVAVQR